MKAPVLSRLVSDHGWKTTENPDMVITHRNGLYRDQVVCCEFFESEFLLHTGNVYLGALDSDGYTGMKADAVAKLLHDSMEERFTEHYNAPRKFNGTPLTLDNFFTGMMGAWS